MDPQAMAALLPILEGLVALGIPGILLGVAAIPALVIGHGRALLAGKPVFLLDAVSGDF